MKKREPKQNCFQFISNISSVFHELFHQVVKRKSENLGIPSDKNNSGIPSVTNSIGSIKKVLACLCLSTNDLFLHYHSLRNLKCFKFFELTGNDVENF